MAYRKQGAFKKRKFGGGKDYTSHRGGASYRHAGKSGFKKRIGKPQFVRVSRGGIRL
jgi:hypothetical protein